MAEVILREVVDDDLPYFFAFQNEEEGARMAAFVARDPADRAAFDAHWAKILADPANVNRTIVVDGEVAGNIAAFPMEGHREVGYWLGRAFWGKGLATVALRQFVDLIRERPLFAHVAKDNIGSLRVLQKCDFQVFGEGSGYSHARGEETAELMLRLD
jgi:RimJ/RimL family protein N-acetyltransferase